MKLFDGNAFAHNLETNLTEMVSQAKEKGISAKVAAVVFKEDTGSRIYTQLKAEAASRVGIAYHPEYVSVHDPVEKVLDCIQKNNEDSSVTGIIIQKPWKKTWTAQLTVKREEQLRREDPTLETASSLYNKWWHSLTSQLKVEKDVDGLHPSLRSVIQNGTWMEQGRVLPATVVAVLYALETAYDFCDITPQNVPHAIIGASDLLGFPLHDVLVFNKVPTTLFRQKSFENQMAQPEKLTTFPVIISATGHKTITSPEEIADNSILIDVGEPKADINLAAVSDKVSFATPVPGGIGPLTVVSLLENTLKLALHHAQVS